MNKQVKINKLFYVLSHVLGIVWMLVIFSFSAQPGEESADLSGGISYVFISILNQVIRIGWDEAEILQMAQFWDYPIRKLAHMTEFGILAILYYWALGFYPKVQQAWGNCRPGWLRYILAFVLTVCYATTDEFHQLFIPERSGNLFDICVDATGAFLVLVCLWVLTRLLKVFFKVRHN